MKINRLLNEIVVTESALRQIQRDVIFLSGRNFFHPAVYLYEIEIDGNPYPKILKCYKDVLQSFFASYVKKYNQNVINAMVPLRDMAMSNCTDHYSLVQATKNINEILIKLDAPEFIMPTKIQSSDLDTVYKNLCDMYSLVLRYR